jgi:hypothetical protein
VLGFWAMAVQVDVMRQAHQAPMVFDQTQESNETLNKDSIGRSDVPW